MHSGGGKLNRSVYAAVSAALEAVVLLFQSIFFNLGSFFGSVDSVGAKQRKGKDNMELF